MENYVATEQLELLCVRPRDVNTAPAENTAHTGSVSLHPDKPRARKNAFTALRRGAAFCLSAALLVVTPVGGGNPSPSVDGVTAMSGLMLQSEIAEFPSTFQFSDLPILSFADSLLSLLPDNQEPEAPQPDDTDSLVPSTPDGDPAVPQLDTGLNFPSNSRISDGLLSSMLVASPSEAVRELPISPVSTYGYDAYQNVYVLNGSGKTLDLPALLEEPLALAAPSSQPQILIYHTHTCEAYTPGPLDTYVTDSSDRCADPAYNVVRVGEEIADVLRARGIGVIHDTTLYDSPSYTGAYARSLASVQDYIERYPSIEIVIDVHRDALNQPDSQKYKLVADVDGQTSAQVMLVMGTDAAAGDHPNWKENVKLALRVQEQMANRYPTLARPIKLTRSSYNQFSAKGAMIVEVGANGNSLSEAILAGRLFADSLAEVLESIDP